MLLWWQPSGQVYRFRDDAMTKYQLAKLILMAGGLQSRKRVQKTVHLLRAAGFPLGGDFRLHYYGPYSSDLADLLDRMTGSGILRETEQPTEVGIRYDYELGEEMRESLEAYEQTAKGRAAKEEMATYEDVVKRLCETGPRVLELASTIVAFREGGCSWPEALGEAAEFKGERTDSRMMTEALDLAQTVVGRNDG